MKRNLPHSPYSLRYKIRSIEHEIICRSILQVRYVNRGFVGQVAWMRCGMLSPAKFFSF